MTSELLPPNRICSDLFTFEIDVVLPIDDIKEKNSGFTTIFIFQKKKVKYITFLCILQCHCGTS